MPHFGLLRTGPGAASSVTVGASPFVFTATRDGLMLINAGTVSLVEIGRQGTFSIAGVLAGAFPLRLGDSLRVTYVVVPTMTFLPG
jgi:hypothetical protein